MARSGIAIRLKTVPGAQGSLRTVKNNKLLIGREGDLPIKGNNTMKTILFSPGQIVATPGALELAEQGLNLMGYLSRHLRGDWGDLDKVDIQENIYSLKNGYRLLSSYTTRLGKLWIITEADRSVTTLLLPGEY
jgi:hypothetical protein